MKIVVIGGSGHVGTYLVPMLVEAGHEVINVSRGRAAPYLPHPAWDSVTTVTLDRKAEDAAGTLGGRIAELGGEVVVDMIGFTLASTQHLVEALRGRVQHFLHCGTIWVYGFNPAVPAAESDPHNGFGEYGLQKGAIERWLQEQAKGGFPATVFRPGHIVGPGWVPLNPAGNGNPVVFQTILRGDELLLPNFGMETLHHVHAEDVAQVAFRAIANRDRAVGEAFNAVSAQAWNGRGLAEALFRHYGHEPNIRYLDFAAWKETQSEADADTTWEHISRSPSHSIEKARQLLGYAPKWSSLDALIESVDALVAAGRLG